MRGSVAHIERSLVEKLRMSVDIVAEVDVGSLVLGDRRYAAPNLTETSFETPGSCMVTP
jgi:hypothetical protein